MAIIRRTLSGKKIYEADRMHLHHRLLSLGLTHRGTVLVIYGISFLFSLISLLFNVSSRVGGVLLILSAGFGLVLFCELIGIFGENRTPLLNLLRFIGNSGYRQERVADWKERRIIRRNQKKD